MTRRTKYTSKDRKLERLGPPLEPPIRLTKKEVAQREIDGAIDLHLSGADGVPVYVLAMAAIHVLEGVAKHTQVVTPLEVLTARIEPEFQRDYRDTFNGPYNFMKHGGATLETLEDFLPSIPYLTIVMAVSTFGQVFGDLTPRTPAFEDWLEANHPGMFERLTSPGL